MNKIKDYLNWIDWVKNFKPPLEFDSCDDHNDYEDDTHDYDHEQKQRDALAYCREWRH